MNPLDTLRTELDLVFKAALNNAGRWTDDAANQRLVEEVRKRHDGPGSPPNPMTVAAAVAHFRKKGEPEGWRGLKWVCFGAGSVDENGWCVLADDRLRKRLFELAQGQQIARKRVKCFQYLLSSYWNFPRDKADQESFAGWLALRKWLDDRVPSVLTDLQNDLHRVPGWFQTLLDHRNLLSDDPCGRYGPRLLAGDSTEFHAMMSGLGIPSDSWVPEEAVLAQVRTACKLVDAEFRERLPNLLGIAKGKTELAISESIKRKCVSMLVSRYAKIPGTPEHPALRDTAVNVIGNPWLRRAWWDAYVVDEHGRPDNKAREMVLGWLRRRLIKDFFELLSTDGAGDRRRLDYWLRFEPFMGDMWFALGANTRRRRDEAFKDFRARAKGRLLNLDRATADNNAFVLKMGDYVVIEFGETGNALYMFEWGRLPSSVLKKLSSGKEQVDVAIDELKSREHAQLIMRHLDSPVAMESWEQKFDAEICPVLGVRPTERPALVPELESLLSEYGIEAEDMRPQGGALWVYADDSHARFNARMRAMGFRYRSQRGWFKE